MIGVKAKVVQKMTEDDCRGSFFHSLCVSVREQSYTEKNKLFNLFLFTSECHKPLLWRPLYECGLRDIVLVTWRKQSRTINTDALRDVGEGLASLHVCRTAAAESEADSNQLQYLLSLLCFFFLLIILTTVPKERRKCKTSKMNLSCN